MRGRVQGVAFPLFVRERAVVDGLGGWTRNRDDGAVEIVIEGDREAVGRFEGRVRQGPAGSRVDHVDVVEIAAQAVRGFEIRR